MQRRGLIATAGAMALATVLSSGLAMAEWPEKPVTIIVPWSAGGSTDQVTRVIAGELSGALGQEVVVVNQPGASGSIGTKSALDAAKDGHTWTAGAAQDLGSYGVLGMLETSVTDWHLFLDVANVSVVGVNADAPYEDLGQLIDAMKADPGSITVATAGISSAGHNAIELGSHPEDGKPISIRKGRYGPYIKHGRANATLPKDREAESVTLEEAVALLAEKAAKAKTNAC